jgi:hypothetical protein
MPDPREFVTRQLSLAKHAIECGRDEAPIPSGYLNFDVALAIVAGCRNAIVMADAHDPDAIVQQLERAGTSLAYVQSGPAIVSVQTARTHIDATIAALLRNEVPD